jgi:hypothetical protein
MKKLLVLPFLFLFVALRLPAQQTGPRGTFGLLIGLESQLLGIEPLEKRPDRLAYVEATRPSFGAGVGAFARWPLFPGLFFQPELSVAFLHNSVIFRSENDVERRRRYRFTDVELPLHLVFIQPQTRFPLRASVTFGARLGWNILPTSDEQLGFLHERLGLDAGLGAELRLGPWHLQPEVLYSHGLNNLHDVQNRPYDKYAGRMVRDRVTVRVLLSKN